MSDPDRSKLDPALPHEGGASTPHEDDSTQRSDGGAGDGRPLKQHGDALLDGSGSRHGEAPDASRKD